MQILSGQAIMNQIVVGPLYFYHRRELALQVRSGRSREQEEARFRKALSQSVLELAGLYDRASGRMDAGTASIFAIHAMLLEDEDFVQNVLCFIQQDDVTAEYAVQRAGEDFAAAFSAMDSAYMRARAADMLDISRRVIRALTGGWQTFLLHKPVILVADHFLPSEVMEFDCNLLGLISQEGSLDSHTALLVRACHIPAMVGVPLDTMWNGHLALMDGNQGLVYVDPDLTLMEDLRVRYQEDGRPDLCIVS